MINSATIIMLSGIFLTNLSIILAAWIKMNTDITAINVALNSLEFRVSGMESDHSKAVEQMHGKMERFSELNNNQHEVISNKIDGIKENVNSIKVDLAKFLK